MKHALTHVGLGKVARAGLLGTPGLALSSTKTAGHQPNCADPPAPPRRPALVIPAPQASSLDGPQLPDWKKPTGASNDQFHRQPSCCTLIVACGRCRTDVARHRIRAFAPVAGIRFCLEAGPCGHG